MTLVLILSWMLSEKKRRKAKALLYLALWDYVRDARGDDDRVRDHDRPSCNNQQSTRTMVTMEDGGMVETKEAGPTGMVMTIESNREQEEEEEQPAILEDPADILDVSLPRLFSIAPIAFSTSHPDAFHTYTPPSASSLRPIRLHIPQPSAEVYTKLHANHLWLAAVYLADCISLGEIRVEGRVAELGAAAGLPGIVACQKGAKVVSTDWGDEDILSTLRDNFTRSCARNWSVIAHAWGSDPTPPLVANTLHATPHPFDYLLLADTLWATEAHVALLDSVWNLLRPGGVAHFAAGLHTGRGPLDRLVIAARKRGGFVEMKKEVKWKSEGRWDDWQGMNEGSEEERGVVIYFTLTIPR